MRTPVILTGLRANNDLTLGNYFGGIFPIVDMAKKRADEFRINLFVPDLHSFTTPIDYTELQTQIWHNLRIFAAAGLPLDHPNVYLYRQSYISAHSELTWILDCLTGVGELQRMTEFKDKSKKLSHDRISMGLFNYPVLMASDILLYNATYVPVGDDQRQHLEFTRDVAERTNNKFGEIFTIPKSVQEQYEFFGKNQGLRIMDLHDPTKKMSKSDESGKGVIFLSDDSQTSAKKIMNATTDNKGSINFNRQEQPGISNLLEILALLTHRPLNDVVDEWRGKESYGDFKKAVAHEAVTFLNDFQATLAKVDDGKLQARLESSELELSEIANQTLLRIQKAVGLR
jgi:tryptophanyl-tRNA synthetase